MSDVPPPPMNPMPPMPGPVVDPVRAVQGPAIFLLVVGGLEIVGSLLGLLLNLLGVGMGAVAGGDNAGGLMMRGSVGILSAIFGLCLGAIIIFGALKMKKLQSYSLAMTGAIAAMLPCSVCCLIGLPAGIWALVVMMKPEVKSAFTK